MGSKPTPGPNANGLASQWNIGFRRAFQMVEGEGWLYNYPPSTRHDKKKPGYPTYVLQNLTWHVRTSFYSRFN